MKHLFIGGTWDGERRTYIGTPPERITVMVIGDQHIVPDFLLAARDFWTVPPDLQRDYEEYHKCTFQVRGVEFVVYTHGWMDTALVFQRLLDHYTVVNKA